MNFEVKTIRIFKIDFDSYQRIYSVLKKKNGLLKLTNIINGKTFIDNLNPEIITINNEPMENIKQLENVVYNPKCVCDENEDTDEFKIFDKSFDTTFE